MSDHALDDAVFAASKELRGRGAPEPDALMLFATGVGLVPSTLGADGRFPLEGVAGVPRAWRGATLQTAEAHGATFWMLEDAPGCADGLLSAGAREPAWARAFPIWLAACSGATLCLHTSAGSDVSNEREARTEAGATLALARDHINLSGGTPLFGLGESRLGALFPDQTAVHHAGLRREALEIAGRRGLNAREVVLACSAGPALETPAEREFYARAGAEVSVQDLAAPLIAAAHCGLSCLSVVAVLQEGPEVDVARLLEGAEALAPSLEELVEGLVPILARVSLDLREEL